jgi:hypothetical protein
MATAEINAWAITASGEPLSASVAVLIAAPSVMLAGFDVSPLAGESAAAAFTRVGKLLPGSTFTRIYNGPGDGFTKSSWAPGGPIAALPANATPAISIKDTPTAAIMNPALAAATRPWFLIVHHEPEGDLPVSQFKADQAAADALIAAHPNGHLCTRVEDYTQYEQVHNNKPGYSIAAMYSGATILALDCYRDSTVSGTTSYPDPATFFAPLVNAAKTLVAKDGKPPRIAVPELGGTLIAGDTGTKRATWITACIAYLRSVGCIAVAWWFTGGEDLTADPVGLSALQAAVAGR